MNMRYFEKLGLAASMLLASLCVSAQTEPPFNIVSYGCDLQDHPLQIGAYTSGGQSCTTNNGSGTNNSLENMIKQGRLDHTQLIAHSYPGIRSYTVTVPINGGTKYIHQLFTLKSEDLEVDPSILDRSTSFGATCAGDPTDPAQCPCNGNLLCPGYYTFSASNQNYDLGLYWSLQKVDYPKFDLQNPKAYQLPSALAKPTYYIDITTYPDPGIFISQYSVSTSFAMTVKHYFQPWQINEILADRLHPKGGSQMEVIVDDPLNFGFTPEEATKNGRWDRTNKNWIRYDHFNWIQHVLIQYDEKGNPQNLSDPGHLQYLGPDGLDPGENVEISGCSTDPWPYYLSEVKVGGYYHYFDASEILHIYKDKYGNPIECDRLYFDYVPPPPETWTWKKGLAITDKPIFNVGWSAIYETKLVGVITPASSSYDPLGEIFPQKGMAFYWSWWQLEQGGDATIFATPLDIGGEGVATIFWEGDNPPPDVNPFPFLRVIDINPGSSPNVINLRSTEVPIAILSTSDHNASEIDPASVRFGPGKATQSRSPEVKDVNEDGNPDLVLYFRTQEAGILCKFIGASVTGQTWDGQFIAGTDSFTTVECPESTNLPPIANAGSDQGIDPKIYKGSLVTLDGTGSSDPDKGPSALTFAWSTAPGTNATLTGTNTANPTLIATEVGTNIFRLIVSDGAANASDEVAVMVTYDFTGFLPPVDNLPVFNQVKAGSAVPVKFSLKGDQGMTVFAANYPTSKQVSCPNSASIDMIEETVTASNSGLNYDPATDMYNYVWKTEKTWAGSCREMNVKLIDGTSRTALFNFTK